MFSIDSILSNSPMPEKAEVIPVVEVAEEENDVEIIEKPSDRTVQGVWQKEKSKSGITKSSKNRKVVPQKRKSWTPQEKELLKLFLFGRPLTVEDCTEFFPGRTRDAVKTQIVNAKGEVGFNAEKLPRFWHNYNEIVKEPSTINRVMQDVWQRNQEKITAEEIGKKSSLKSSLWSAEELEILKPFINKEEQLTEEAVKEKFPNRTFKAVSHRMYAERKILKIRSQIFPETVEREKETVGSLSENTSNQIASNKEKMKINFLLG